MTVARRSRSRGGGWSARSAWAWTNGSIPSPATRWTPRSSSGNGTGSRPRRPSSGWRSRSSCGGGGPWEILQIVAAFRGDDARVRSLRDRLARLTAGHEDPQLAATALATRIFVAYSRRDLVDAVEALQELRHRQLGRTEERLVERMIGFAVGDRQLLVGQTVTTGRADEAGLDMA